MKNMLYRMLLQLQPYREALDSLSAGAWIHEVTRPHAIWPIRLIPSESPATLRLIGVNLVLTTRLPNASGGRHSNSAVYAHLNICLFIAFHYCTHTDFCHVVDPITYDKSKQLDRRYLGQTYSTVCHCVI